MPGLHFEQFQKNAKHASIAALMSHVSTDQMACKEARFTETYNHVVATTTKRQYFPGTSDEESGQLFFKPQIGLNFACRHCHNGIAGSEKTDQELVNAAYGYHDRPAEPPLIPTPTPVPVP
jgi:hypothetical protein